MRAPEFWNAEASGRDRADMLRVLLTPVSALYAWAAARRWRTATPHRAPVPVVCVGNFTVGGAGKTPITRAVRAALGPGAHTLSRGYGGRLRGPVLVDAGMSASDAGDEPLVHAVDGPAWIARDRVAGALAAAEAGARAIVMDDGFQNPGLAKDVNIVAVDPAFRIGNGRVFPAGPLRERLADGLARADAIVMLHPAEADRAPAPDWLSGFDKPVLHATLAPSAPPPSGKLIAFAGLARPEKFFAALRSAGAELEDAIPFADHHAYAPSDLELLSRIASERGARLITTEKDAARLAPDWRARVAVLPVTARFDDADALHALLVPIRARMS